MKKLFAFLLLSFALLGQTPVYLSGFTSYPYFNEQVLSYKILPDVRVFITAPGAQEFKQYRRTVISLFALPNGNTIEQTLGKTLRPGDDWHFDIQHIGAQTRFLRNADSSVNYVTVYLESSQKSWPTWKSSHADYPVLIPQMVNDIKNLFAAYNPEIVLTGHSGGGSFTFGYLDGIASIPSFIKRISFLDSNYGYDNTYGPKFLSWLNASGDNYLSVIAYNDSVALLNGTPVVSPTGGTWYRSKMMAAYLALTFPETYSADSDFRRYTYLNGRAKFILKENPARAILHTVQVELNGYIQGVLSGTAKEGTGYTYYGSRAYTQYVQPGTPVPPPLTIPPRPAGAMTGSQFMQSVSSLSFADRENAILSQLMNGNIPDFMRRLKRLTSQFQDANGTPHTVVYEVMPDYLCIGSDSDYCRIPMGPKTAQKVADFYGAVMTTPKLTDDIYSKSEIKLAPVTYTPVGNQNELVPKFIEHNTAIETQRRTAGGQLGQLIGGTKKDVVLSNLISSQAGRVCIYGWHQLNGTPIQPLTNIHIDTYTDYSHGIRFVNNSIVIDTAVRLITATLKDAVMYKLLSNESAPMTQASYFADTTLPTAPKSFCVLPLSTTGAQLKLMPQTGVQTYLFRSANGLTFSDSIPVSGTTTIDNLPAGTITYFRLKNYNSYGSSAWSEVLAVLPAGPAPEWLIVNGFDRASAGNTYNFIRQHGGAVAALNSRLNLSLGFASCTNEALTDGLMALAPFRFTDVILGDESTVDETFSSTEQALYKVYLNNGGKLFVSGCEIAWDLDSKGSTSDKDFIWNYLRCSYVNDAPGGVSSVTYRAQGISNATGEIMPSLFFDNGTQGTINVKWPDVIRPFKSVPMATYFNYDTTNGTAAVFSQTVNAGKDTRVFVLAFPFETIYPDSTRNKVMENVYNLFTRQLSVSVREKDDNIVSVTYPYPNPFTDETKLNITLTSPEKVTVVLYDILGKEADTLCSGRIISGTETITISNKQLSQGMYLCRITIGGKQYIRKIMLLK